MAKRLILLTLLRVMGTAGESGGDVPKPPGLVLSAYVKAVGGEAAVNGIETREVEAKGRGREKLIYYWQKPDKVLLMEGKKKTGWDGGSGWMLSSKKKVSKLPKGAQRPLQIDANPLRYVQLKQLYPEAEAAAPETLDGTKMNVIVAANDRGETKFYFDAGTHLLARIEETGDTSAYFKHTIDFSDYQDTGGVKFPFTITHTSTEPDAKELEIKVSKVTQNVPIPPQVFVKPTEHPVVLGGK